MQLNESYWTKRYMDRETGWDIGYAVPTIVEFMKQFPDKSIKILIPGCGNAYEAKQLWQMGFRNIFLLDYALLPLQKFQSELPEFPVAQLLHLDFFSLQDQFDLVLEQTFFCALDPNLREKYVQHMHQIIRPNGHLAGLLFDDPLFSDHPPYGGNKALYQKLFEPKFKIKKMETAYNSIPARQGRELFFILQPKK